MVSAQVLRDIWERREIRDADKTQAISDDEATEWSVGDKTYLSLRPAGVVRMDKEDQDARMA